jgi:hypothetical protein
MSKTIYCSVTAILAAALFPWLRSASGGLSAQAVSAKPLTPDQAIGRIITREHHEVEVLQAYHPIIETYIQNYHIHRGEPVLWRDAYFLGQAETWPSMTVKSLISERNHGGRYFGEFDPRGFLQEIYVDPTGFDRQHYRFRYAGREFLGEVRCIVFDIGPLKTSDDGRFRGRIWAEDQDFTIVRFSGTFVPRHHWWTRLPTPRLQNGVFSHFDSWRFNAQPGLWLPACIFDEQNHMPELGILKSQTRFWGYDIHNIGAHGEFTDLSIESASPLQNDSSLGEEDQPPVQAQRVWRAEAETNALTTLQRIGLLAAPGEVDKTLNTVVNNLEVTNKLDIEPEVHCRVLITSDLEMFSIGHTIVMSRGLLDVLPDEATLAAMVAQELAYVMDSKSVPDLYGFGDVLQVTPADVVERFRSRESKNVREAASDKALALLRNSPYSSQLGKAGLFLKQLHEESRALSQLINPTLGNSVYFSHQLMGSSPSLQPTHLDQIAALPIGGRIALDPWNDTVELLKAPPVRITSAREKIPFEITPFMPFLRRYKTANERTEAGDLIAPARPIDSPR